MEEEVEKSTFRTQPPLPNSVDPMEDNVNEEVDADTIFRLQESCCEEGKESNKHMEEEVNKSLMQQHTTPNYGESIEDHGIEEVDADNMFKITDHVCLKKHVSLNMKKILHTILKFRIQIIIFSVNVFRILISVTMCSQN